MFKARALRLIFALVLLAAPACAETAHSGAPSVHIDVGVVNGVEANGVRAFKGIPYAAPPVGPLRWRAPQPAAHWTAPLDAMDFGASCMQAQTPRFAAPNSRGATTSEDCLTLNVWSPSNAHRAPVLVWIHGGGNTDGTSAQSFYDGSSFARDGVILVSFNYRLGLFGFFAHPALTAAQPREATNFGLLDQIAALKWVQRNIAAFGGDPSNVTVAGESAGGEDIIDLMTSPAARGLFQRAIAESPGMGWDIPIMAEAEDEGRRAATDLNASDLAALRALPADALVHAGVQHQIGPAIDGALLPQAPLTAFAAGRAAAVPLLIGTNNGEGSIMGGSADFAGVWPALSAADLATLRAGYGAEASTDVGFTATLFRDGFFAAPSRFVAAHNAAPTYMYRFDYLAVALRARRSWANHGSEIPFVFQTGDTYFTNADRPVAAALHACWASFARTGTPSCGADWPRFGAEQRIMVFADTPSAQPIAHRDLLDLLEQRLNH